MIIHCILNNLLKKLVHPGVHGIFDQITTSVVVNDVHTGRHIVVQRIILTKVTIPAREKTLNDFNVRPCSVVNFCHAILSIISPESIVRRCCV